MSQMWVVLLEAVRDPVCAELDKETLSRLLHAIAQVKPVALHTDDRYAVQMDIPARSSLEALESALAAWSGALTTVGVPPWEVVRAEVTTRMEFEAELALAEARTPQEVDDDAVTQAFEDLVSRLASGHRPLADSG